MQSDIEERWWLRLIGLGCAAAALVTNHFYPDWGRATLISALVFVGLLFIWRHYWGNWWFWGTMTAVAVVHALFLQSIRDLLNSQNIFGLFVLGVLEALIISFIMSVPIHLFSSKGH